MKYVILLRGVNAGGNRRVPKVEFQKVLEALGFQNVFVYINSGNAVFSSDNIPKSTAVEKALEAHFGFEIPTLVLSGEKIRAIAAAIPSDWTNDKPNPEKSGQRCDVVYLFDDVNSPDTLKKIGYTPDNEKMIYVDGAILANISWKNYNKYSLRKVMGTPLYKQITIRNINTAKKLAELAHE